LLLQQNLPKAGVSTCNKVRLQKFDSITPSARASAHLGAHQPKALGRGPEGSGASVYFAAVGNAGNLSMSRASCWMITVALRFAASFLMRSIDASVCARSKLNIGTPLVS